MADQPTHLHDLTDPVRVGNRWLFASGRSLPVVAGGDGPEEPVVIPAEAEALAGLEDEALQGLIDEARAQFERLRDSGSRDLPAMTALVEGIERAEGEQTRRVEEDERIAAEIDELAGRLDPAASDTGDGAGDGNEPPEGGEGGEGGDGGDAGDGAGDEGTEGAEGREPVGAGVTAGGGRTQPRRPPLRNVRGQQPRTPAPNSQPDIAITAAADVPGIATGARFGDLRRVAVAMHDKARMLRNGGSRAPIARIRRPMDPAAQLTEDPARNEEIISTLVNSRLAGGAAGLVAAGGWCVPSQPLFDMFEIGGAEDLLDLPGVGAVRGGITVPTFFTQADAQDAMWEWTEADDIAADPEDPLTFKPCLRIPCPTWSDNRLRAFGICVTHGNLSNQAFPELTRRFLNIVMSAHEHRMSIARITALTTGATAIDWAAGTSQNSDAAGDLLEAILYNASEYRSQFQAPRSQVVEIALPSWTIDMLRSNVAKRAGVDMLNVTDQQVVGWITSRGVRPQFLSDYQRLWDGSANTSWPATLQFLMWFSGAYVAGQGGEIDLGVVRDSTLNRTNDYTAAWSEEFEVVARRGPLARQVTIDLTVDGVTACCPEPEVVP